MALYQRCPDAKNDLCGKLVRSKKGGVAEDTEHNIYETCEKPQGCRKTGDTDCKCFVVAMHVKLKDGDSEESKEEITEEVTYPGSRIHNKNEEELLNVEKRTAEHPGKGPGHEKSFWKVECRCLAVDKDGKPIKL